MKQTFSVQAIALGAALALFALLSPAVYAASSVYTVSAVQVDVTAESASKAREQALAQGQAAALTQLLQRLTLQADWPRLPTPDSVRLDSLVAGFAVSDEHASTTRYLAKVTYDFVPDEVRRLLRGNNVPFAESRSKPVLVLPLLAATDGSYLLWEPQNIWGAAWRAQPLAELLVPLIVPMGDLDDVADLRAYSPGKADWAAVQTLAAKYDAGSVLVPILTLRKTAVGLLGDLRVQELKPEGASETRRAVQGADQAAVMNDAIQGIAATLQETWKTANVVADGTASSLDADVSFNGLQQWLNLRRSLEQVPTVRAMRVIGFSVDGARVSLSYLGSQDQLATSLAQRDLVLRLAGPGAWVIEPRASAAAPPAPAPTPVPGPAKGPS